MTSGGGRDPSDDDRAAFRHAVRDVRPIRPDPGTVPLRRRPPHPEPLQARRDDLAVLAEMALCDPSASEELEYGEALHFERPGVRRATVKRLRRGEYAQQAALDLHGLTVAEAKERLVAFLHHCVAREYACVRIVHGKGHGSPGRLPILKPKVAHWLAQRQDVLAYTSARTADGGTGALYVLLRRRR